MGRHGASSRSRIGRLRSSRLALVVALVVLVAALAGLGSWWWALRSAVDPIAADPVAATAVVTASAPCDQAGRTTVRLAGLAGAPEATLDGCGFVPGQRLDVEYLAGHPDHVRLAGTSTAGRDTVAAKVLPIAILVSGIAVIVLLWLLISRRRRPRRGAAEAVSVADLRARIAAARSAPEGGRPEPSDAS